MNTVKTPLLPRLARKALLAWFFAAGVCYLLLPAQAKDLSGTAALEALYPPGMALLFLGVLAGLLFLPVPETAERYGIPAALALVMVPALFANFSWPLTAAVGLVLALGLAYARYGYGREAPAPPKPVHSPAGVWVGVLAVVFFVAVSLWTGARVLTFSAPSFDFGIFSQMFYYLKTKGLALTTLERDGLLSHFQVHMSPIFYLLVPIYALFPYPVTLQICQAAIMASAAWPLYLLAQRRGLPGWESFAVCAMLLLNPGYGGGAGYDFHENAFLAPLLLWLFYAMDRKWPYAAGLFALLTLLVKEDAAVYVAVVGLYHLLAAPVSRDGRFRGLMGAALLAVSVVWFLIATGFLARFGDGVMTYRYENFFFGGKQGLFTVIQAALLCPMKAAAECLEPEKLGYLAFTLLPMLPAVLTRRYHRLVLLLPYCLVNLMSDYTYQHQLYFQYSFGSLACLAYLAAVNLRDLPSWRPLAAAGMVGAAIACFGFTVAPQGWYYSTEFVQYYDNFRAVSAALHAIPEDAKVAATTFYTTPLSQREVLYDLDYASKEHLFSCDLFALDPRWKDSFAKFGGFDALKADLLSRGYAEWEAIPGVLVIFSKNPPGAAP